MKKTKPLVVETRNGTGPSSRGSELRGDPVSALALLGPPAVGYYYAHDLDGRVHWTHSPVRLNRRRGCPHRDAGRPCRGHGPLILLATVKES